MLRLTVEDRNELIRLLQAGEQIPAQWRGKLFPGGSRSVEIGKEYRLEYSGKMKREQVLAETPAAPWQLVRRFAEDRPHSDGWRNLLVWGDNLLALIREHQPVLREDIDRLLMDKLPDILTETQKLDKIHNMLNALSRKNGLIRNVGGRRYSRWVLSETQHRD